jgi:hypothetical protein
LRAGQTRRSAFQGQIPSSINSQGEILDTATATHRSLSIAQSAFADLSHLYFQRSQP